MPNTEARVRELERQVKEILTGHEENKRDDLLNKLNELEARVGVRSYNPGDYKNDLTLEDRVALLERQMKVVYKGDSVDDSVV